MNCWWRSSERMGAFLKYINRSDKFMNPNNTNFRVRTEYQSRPLISQDEVMRAAQFNQGMVTNQLTQDHQHRLLALQQQIESHHHDHLMRYTIRQILSGNWIIVGYDQIIMRFATDGRYECYNRIGENGSPFSLSSSSLIEFVRTNGNNYVVGSNSHGISEVFYTYISPHPIQWPPQFVEQSNNYWGVPPFQSYGQLAVDSGSTLNGISAWSVQPQKPSSPSLPPLISHSLDIYFAELQAKTGKEVKQEFFKLFTQCSDKSQINQMFFELSQDHFVPKEKLTRDSQNILSKMLETNIKKGSENKVQNLLRDAELNRREALQNYQNADQNLQRMTKYVREADELSGRIPDVNKLIEMLDSDPFWSLDQTRIKEDQNYLDFISSDIVCNYINKTQGIEQLVNFGKFKVKWDMVRNRYQIYPHLNNIEIDSHYHPHISGTQLCLGSAADSFTKAQMNFDVSGCLKLIQSLMQTYNPDSPYRKLEHWWLKQNPKLQEGATKYQPSGEYFWLRSDRLNFAINFMDSETIEAYDYNDEFEIYKTEIFHKVNAEYGVRVDQEEYAQSPNGKFHLIDGTDDTIWRPDD